MTQDKDQMRAEFESWCCPQADKNAIAKFDDGFYMSAKTSMAWAAWQAARASAPQGVPAFSHVAQRKLTELQDKGYAITGYAIEQTDARGKINRGFINGAGFVGWFRGQQGAPEGWQLVPKRPTQSMCEAAKFHVDGRLSVFKWADGYYAMLAEAPQPVAQKDNQ